MQCIGVLRITKNKTDSLDGINMLVMVKKIDEVKFVTQNLDMQEVTTNL